MRSFTCAGCGTASTVEGMCFYDLCDTCFPAFDAWKMKRRFREGVVTFESESVAEWLKEKRKP